MRKVALLAEGVDRNIYTYRFAVSTGVALLAEGVDRNYGGACAAQYLSASPSSRRAWIEISVSPTWPKPCDGRPPRGGRPLSWPHSRGSNYFYPRRCCSYLTICCHVIL